MQQLAESVPDNGGVMFVPAFTGLGAPHWNPDARGTIVGLTRGTTIAHIARAALESIAFQSAALLEAMSRDVVAGGGAPVAELRVDGGACVNDLLMQFQADLLGIPVIRPKVIETTALGAAYLAGLSCGIWSGTDELAAQWQVERTFHPTMSRARAGELMQRWEHAVAQAFRKGRGFERGGGRPWGGGWGGASRGGPLWFPPPPSFCRSPPSPRWRPGPPPPGEWRGGAFLQPKPPRRPRCFNSSLRFGDVVAAELRFARARHCRHALAAHHGPCRDRPERHGVLFGRAVAVVTYAFEITDRPVWCRC